MILISIFLTTTVGRSLHDLLGLLLHILKTFVNSFTHSWSGKFALRDWVVWLFSMSWTQIFPPRRWLAYSFTFSTASLESANLSLLTWLCRSPGFWLPASLLTWLYHSPGFWLTAACLTSLSSCLIPMSSSQHSGLHGSSSRQWQGSSCHPVPSLKLSIRKPKGWAPPSLFMGSSLWAYFWVFSECVEKVREGLLLGPQELQQLHQETFIWISRNLL